MSQENVEVVRRAIAAVNERDTTGYLACCTPDVQLRTPLAAVGGEYEGRDGIRRFFDDIEDANPDFQINVEGVEALGLNLVLASVRVSASGRSSGAPAATEALMTNVYDLVRGRISRVRIFLDRHEALDAAGLSE